MYSNSLFFFGRFTMSAGMQLSECVTRLFILTVSTDWSANAYWDH